MHGSRLLAASAAVVTALTAPAVGLETDQYLVWGHALQDSTDRLNAYVNENFEHVLERVNRRHPEELSCEVIPLRAYRRLASNMLFSRVRHFLRNDPEIDRFPEGKTGYFGYLHQSIFRRPAFPFLLPMARTVRLNGVNVGTDKIAGHFFGFGRRYLRHYRRARDRGLSEDEALRKIVRWGVHTERWIVGGLSDGVFSHADLEANYQGFRMALDLCETGQLELTSAGWILSHPVDLRSYINPDFDESFNNSHFTRARWAMVRPVLKREYCGPSRAPEVQALLADYRARERPSFSQLLVAEEFPRLVRRQYHHSLEAICPTLTAERPAGVRGRWAARRMRRGAPAPGQMLLP